MVLELCKDKNLLQQLYETPNRRFPESKCAQYIHTIAKGVQYLHDNYVVHRDLKPENILFDKKGKLKIADFGSAHHFHPNDSSTALMMKTETGTPLYVAPEIITNSTYSHKCDLWSLGVILYILLCGYHPFSAGRKSIDKMYHNIINGIYKFETISSVPY